MEPEPQWHSVFIPKNVCQFFSSEIKLFLRTRFEWRRVLLMMLLWYMHCSVSVRLSVRLQLCLGMSQLLYSRLMPFGVFLAQRHTKCVLTIFLPSGSCNWTDVSKVSGFSGKYFRRKILTIILEYVFNYILFYYPPPWPHEVGVECTAKEIVLTWQWVYFLSGKRQRLNF